MRFEARDPGFDTRIRASFVAQAFMGTLGATLTRIEPGHVSIRVPRPDGLTQQNGFFHAGVLGAIADSAAGYAAYTLMDADDDVLSIEYKINLLRPANGEAVEARASVIKPGRTLTVCSADVFVESEGAETQCAVVQLTMMRLVSAGA